MRGLRIVLLVSFISGVGYAFLLVAVPRQLADLGAGPEEILWARFLVPIYLGLATANWYAIRDPAGNDAVVRGLTVMWGLLALSHVYTGAAGLEDWATGLPWLAFDALVFSLLLYFRLVSGSPDTSQVESRDLVP